MLADSVTGEGPSGFVDGYLLIMSSWAFPLHALEQRDLMPLLLFIRTLIIS